MNEYLLAFEILKEHLIIAPVLYVFDCSLPHQIWVDASGFACGGGLVQKTTDGHWLPVEYVSQWFLAPELNYSTAKGDLITVFLGVKRWCYFLLGSAFIVHSEYASLKQLLL